MIINSGCVMRIYRDFGYGEKLCQKEQDFGVFYVFGRSDKVMQRIAKPLVYRSGAGSFLSLGPLYFSKPTGRQLFGHLFILFDVRAGG